jgi:hypothetical protein
MSKVYESKINEAPIGRHLYAYTSEEAAFGVFLLSYSDHKTETRSEVHWQVLIATQVLKLDSKISNIYI